MNVRIGQGYDVHRLAEGRRLVLGGVEIPNACGLLGHSDADVLLHAIADAMLGAASLRDIGYHFPDNDAATEGIDSSIILREVVQMLLRKGYRVGNIDAIVIAQRPKLASFIPQMQRQIADMAGIDEDSVSVKATTTEHLGFEGREEGIAAQAVVLIEKC